MTKYQETIETAWRGRVKQQMLKPGSMAYRRAELEFFMGAASALQAAFPGEGDKLSAQIPVSWIINPSIGEPIVKV